MFALEGPANKHYKLLLLCLLPLPCEINICYYRSNVTDSGIQFILCKVSNFAATEMIPHNIFSTSSLPVVTAPYIVTCGTFLVLRVPSQVNSIITHC